MYKIKRFSSFVLDYNDVIKYLKSFSIPIDTISRNGALSPGVHFSGKVTSEDKEEIADVISSLISEFKYQFTFGFVGNNLIKFDTNKFIREMKGANDLEFFMQPTTKVKIDRTTKFIPDQILFHGTDAVNVDSILKYGLLPKGRDQINGFKYPPSVHLLINLNQMVNLVNGDLVGAPKWKSNLVLFKINPRKYEFILDPSCEMGCITYQKVSTNDIELVDKSEYQNLFDKYSIKDFQSFISKVIKRIN